MGDHWKVILVCALFAIISKVHCHKDDVPFSYVQGAEQKMAVCIDGSPGAYQHSPGSGDGANNWIVFLMGGGWCGAYCRDRYTGGSNWALGSTKDSVACPFGSILSPDKSINPDFYNWNRVRIEYCDGSCFLGDNEQFDPILNAKLQFRGSRIYDAVMDELLAKGMKNAENAILTGGSAGGLSTMLHCDDFQAKLSAAKRVKCISDSGYFIRGKKVSGSYFRTGEYDDIVEAHNLTSFLPQACVSRMFNPALCMFGENFVGDIKTPLFILNSAFDQFEIQWALRLDNSSLWAGWEKCYVRPDTTTCTPDQLQLIKDFRKSYIESLKGLPHNPSRGLFINSYFEHIFTGDDEKWKLDGTFSSGKKTIIQAIGDWYFDRSAVQLIDEQNDMPIFRVIPKAESAKEL